MALVAMRDVHKWRDKNGDVIRNKKSSYRFNSFQQ